MKKSYYILVLSVVLALSGYPARAQQRPVVSQYMFSGLVMNPAYAGRHRYTSFTAMYRNQWVNIPGAPVTSTFLTQTGLKEKDVGLGLLISNDQIGVHSNTMVYGSYAYVLNFSNGGKLSMGIQAGMDYLRSDWTKLTLPPGSQDDPLFSGTESNVFPNFGAGLYYFTDKFYVGASVPYMLANQKTKSGDTYMEVRHSRNYYVTTGALMQIGVQWVLKPSVLLRMEENMPFGFDLNANLYYNDIIELGLSYRYEDAVIGILGFQINKYLKFSYAYDYVISDLAPYTRGTHELMLQYRINFYAPRKHRMCPGPLYF